MKNSIFTAVTTLGLSASASAATVSLDVGRNLAISGTELVGLPFITKPANTWIDATGAKFNVTGITVGSMTISWVSNHIAQAGNQISTENHRMMNGYMAMNNGGKTYFRVRGLGAEFTTNGYDVYVYLASDTERSHALKGSDGTTTVQVTGVVTVNGQCKTDVACGGDYTTNPTYIKLRGFTGTDCTLTKGSAGGVPQIAGIQIDPSPENSRCTQLLNHLV